MNGLTIRDLTVRYGTGQQARTILSGLDLDVPAGTVVGLVGESGSGKSTIARAVLGLAPRLRGEVAVDGRDLFAMSATERARQVQMVFQDPYASLNPRMSVGQIVGEALQVRAGLRRTARQEEMRRLLELVALDPAVAERRPANLSGGQRQRVAVARALAAAPKVLVADEITSALDVSVQAQVLNVLREVQAREQLSMLFISHSMAVVRYISDVIAVMHQGRIVEAGPTQELLAAPRHPYTRALLEAVPRLGGGADRETQWLPLTSQQEFGESPGGCVYRERCPVGPQLRPDRLACTTAEPTLVGDVGAVACHFPVD